jgi:GNAT superfamily N-acetyltransferase
MDIQKNNIEALGIKITAEENGIVVGRVSVYLIKNDLHDAPYGLLEDVFVEPEYRGQGVGSRLVRAAVEEAKRLGCYKLIGQSRYGREKTHAWYEGLGFKKHGYNFRMDFNK